MFHVSLSASFQTTIHFRSLQQLVKKSSCHHQVCMHFDEVDTAVDSETIASDKACWFV